MLWLRGIASIKAGSILGLAASLVVSSSSSALATDVPARPEPTLSVEVAEKRFRDHGDGTVTDLHTGLMWEKKCSGCGGLHDVRKRLRWSGNGRERTIWDWLDAVNGNGKAGFAGYSDWRIPNVTELMSIVDYGRSAPATYPPLAVPACSSGCTDLRICSCMDATEYWTATTFSDFPAHAWVVEFQLGVVDDRLKTNLHRVRVVRTSTERR